MPWHKWVTTGTHPLASCIQLPQLVAEAGHSYGVSVTALTLNPTSAAVCAAAVSEKGGVPQLPTVLQVGPTKPVPAQSQANSPAPS